MEADTPSLESLWPCFQGMIPAVISTCSRDGTPNISFISQVYYVDPSHLAISFQFFNKTHRNISEHPYACIMFMDPRTLQAYRMRLHYERSEASGPLFDSMSLQLQAIASHVGMSEVFRLRAADVYRVLEIERVEGFTKLPIPPPAERADPLFVGQELSALRVIVERINRTELLGDLLDGTLHLLDEFFEECSEHLHAIEQGLGALRDSAGDAELLHRIFRAAHTIKGNCAMFGLAAEAEFTHGVESLLDALREGKSDAASHADLLLASLMIALAAPLMLSVAVGVALTTPGSIIFKQRRYGLDGREIVVYKFRSMTSSDDDGNVPQARRDDDRITPFGRFIRRFSLDELPQLINVIKGQMSLVGPRPHATEAKASSDLYQTVVSEYFSRHRMKPGVTGWAQINGWRGETDTHEKIQRRVEADLYYIDHWSLAFDLYIIAATPFVLLTGKNAY